MEGGRGGRKETKNMNGTFLPEPSDSLPISGALISILRPRFLLSFVLAHGASSSVVSGSARRQLDELHPKRPTQNFLRLFKHGFERAALQAYHLFRYLIAAERHAPLFLEERETHQIGRAFL